MSIKDDVTDSADETLLKEIRERYQFATDYWKEIREERRKDLLCVVGNVWKAMDPDGLAKRDEKKRPALETDELSQYFNQVINQARANPRGIQFSPLGNGASPETATFYENKTREIEYRSHAQVAYTTALEGAIQGGEGWVRVLTKREHPRSFNQELWIEHIPNAAMVLPDPEALMPDASDMQWLFFHEEWSRTEFKKRFPTKQQDFTGFEKDFALWFPDSDHLVLTEYWVIEQETKTLQQWNFGDGRIAIDYADALDGLTKGATLEHEEQVEVPKVMHYLTNGVEILERTEWKGKYIPFAACYGKVVYVDDGAGAKRTLLSMTRLARKPALFLAYIRSCEAEAIGGVPRTSWIGYQGQFVNPEEWQKSNHEPVTFLEAKTKVEDMIGQEVLPLPQRQAWDPPLHNLEMVAEAARRAIQAAMGISPLPTTAQRQNQKSGVALDRINTQMQVGSFHFLDHYDGLIRRVGVIIEDKIPYVLDTARDVAVRKPNDTSEMVRVNDPQATNPETGEPAMLSTQGDHLVTVSAGPASDSQVAEAEDFLIELAKSPAAPRVLDLLVKAKRLGPIGDEIEQRLTPPEFQKKTGKPNPQQLQQQNAQMSQQLQQAHDVMGKMQKALETEEMKFTAQKDIEQMRIDSNERMLEKKLAADIEKARITAAKQTADLAAEQIEERIALMHDNEQNELNRQHEAARATQDHVHTLAEGDQAHAQSLEAGAQGHDQALEQLTTQAALQPPPAEGAGA